jgi:hypothetical protein
MGKNYTGVLNCFRLTYRNGGIKNFFPGLSLAISKTVPAAALQFSVYEILKNQIFDM